MKNKYLQTDRIYLREMRKEDANGDYYHWLNDPEVYMYLETRFVPWSRAKLREYIESLDGNKNEIMFAICLLEDDRHIGNIKLGPINQTHKFGEIGLLIGEKSEWGKGYAAEAIGLICKFAFEILNLNKLQAGCYEDNIGSAKAFLKNGFLEEGRYRKQWFLNNRYQDSIRMGLLRENYYKRI